MHIPGLIEAACTLINTSSSRNECGSGMSSRDVRQLGFPYLGKTTAFMVLPSGWLAAVLEELPMIYFTDYLYV